MTPDTANLLDMLDAGGEEQVAPYLMTFSCPLNGEVEGFIRHKAVDFARRKLAATYLVNDLDDGQILGYFALAHKAILISGARLSRTSKRKLERFARLDGATGNYMASAFLIAQFGKNYGVDAGGRVDGGRLMGMATDVLSDIQRRIGGGIVYLDCEDRDKLKRFYENEGFQLFGERLTEERRKYLQYMRFF